MKIYEKGARLVWCALSSAQNYFNRAQFIQKKIISTMRT